MASILAALPHRLGPHNVRAGPCAEPSRAGSATRGPTHPPPRLAAGLPSMQLRRTSTRVAMLAALGCCGAAQATDSLAGYFAVGEDAKFEGAIGLDTSYRPEFQGAGKRRFGYRPVIYLRYGRWSISSASGFVNKRGGDVVGGLGVEMLHSDRLRLSLGLRYDNGRSEESSERLEGLGDVPATVRVRAALVWRPAGRWRLGASWSVDAFGRGGGHNGQVDIAWERRLSPTTTYSVSSALSLAGETYMQSYYGITEEQSARSVYPVYDARAGLRDVSLNFGIRHQLGPHWVVAGGFGIARLLDAAAHSPLTTDPFGWGTNLAFAWHF